MSSQLLALARDGLVLALLLVLPILVAAAVAGILVALLGRVTQLSDPSVTMAARVAAVGIAIIGFGPSIAAQVQTFATNMLALIAGLGGAPPS